MAQTGITFGGDKTFFGQDVFGSTAETTNTVFELNTATYNVVGHAFGLYRVRIPIGHATYACTANSVNAKMRIPVGHASFAVTVNDIASKVTIPIGVATFTVTTNDVSQVYRVPLGAADFAVTVNDLAQKMTIPIGHAQFQVTANDIEYVVGTPAATGVTGTRVPSMWYKRIREQREKDTARQKVLADIEMDAILMACATVIEDEEATWLV